MPTETTEMLSLAQMQKTAPEELTALAMTVPNRHYSLALSQMVAAMQAHAVGNKVAMLAHVERAKQAHKHAQEDEHGRVNRIRAASQVMASAVRS